MWVTTPRPRGVVLVGAIAAYTLGRQLLFPLRDNARKTAHGRIRTMALAGTGRRRHGCQGVRGVNATGRAGIVLHLRGPGISVLTLNDTRR